MQQAVRAVLTANTWRSSQAAARGRLRTVRSWALVAMSPRSDRGRGVRPCPSMRPSIVLMQRDPYAFRATRLQVTSSWRVRSAITTGQGSGETSREDLRHTATSATTATYALCRDEHHGTRREHMRVGGTCRGCTGKQRLYTGNRPTSRDLHLGRLVAAIRRRARNDQRVRLHRSNERVVRFDVRAARRR